MAKTEVAGTAPLAVQPVFPRREYRLTKTQAQILQYVAAETALRGGVRITKRKLAGLLGRNVKTVDRLISDLRSKGLIEVEMRFGEDGAQLASEYRAVVQKPKTQG